MCKLKRERAGPHWRERKSVPINNEMKLCNTEMPHICDNISHQSFCLKGDGDTTSPSALIAFIQLIRICFQHTCQGYGKHKHFSLKRYENNFIRGEGEMGYTNFKNQN